MKRGISPLVASLLLIATSIVAVGIFSTMYSNLLERYRPQAQALVLAGTPEIDLMRVSVGAGTTIYLYQLKAPILNMGENPIIISSGEAVILVKGISSVKVTTCILNGNVQIYPNEISILVGTCRLDNVDLSNLFGQSNPPADIVKKNIEFLYIKIVPAVPAGAGGGGNSGSGIVLV